MFKISNELLEKTNIYYGSRLNLPNEETLKASIDIFKLITSLNEHDTLIVVITGGGSSLLCMPEENITLTDVITLSKLLGESGASIIEMNIVRRAIDILKGGGIAMHSTAKNVSKSI